MEFENISASYDVGIAKKYGINCAVLLNKLIYLSKYTSREDGFCWRTSKELEDELGLSRHQQDLAIKKLEENNIIETRNTYIQGTQIKCKHFKIIKSEMLESGKSDFNKSGKSEMPESGKSINNNNTLIIKHSNKEKIYKKELEIEFEEIWKHYPKKVGKSDSFKKYIKARKDGVSKEKILKAVIVYAEQNKTTPSKFIKHGKTWFNGEYWNDEIGETEEERMERLQREIEEEERNEQRWI